MIEKAQPPGLVHESNNVSPYLNIPHQLNDSRIRFIKVKPRGKEALEKGWNATKNYSIRDPEFMKHIQHGGNYGMTFFDGSGAFVDADTPEIQDALEMRLPGTFRYSTGKENHYQYVFFVEDRPIGCYPLKNGAFIKGKGGYALGPGSIPPNGVIYGSREIRDVPIATVTGAQLFDALGEFLVTPSNSNKQKEEGPVANFQIPRSKEVTPEQIEEMISALSETWQKANHLRHVLTLAIIGTCEKWAWDKGSVEKVENGLIQRTGIGYEHLVQVKYAYGRGGRKYGLPTIKKIMEAVEDDNDR